MWTYGINNLSVVVTLSIKLLIPVSIFMKLGTYIIEHEAIWTAHFMIRVYNCIVKTPLGNSSVRTPPRQQIHVQQKGCKMSRFMCDPYRMKRKYAISCAQTLLFIYGSFSDIDSGVLMMSSGRCMQVLATLSFRFQL
jgi:hypothetical protein